MTSTEDQTASTVATVARFSTALERRDVDALLAEMTDDVVLESPGPAPDGERYEVFAAGDRCVVRWRYDWGAGHVRGVDVMRLRDGRIAETLGYVKG